MISERQQKADMGKLMAQPEFRRFLWRVIQMSGILEAVTDGSERRDLAYYEGRRNLGLEILADAEMGQVALHPDRIPILTAIQVLREEAQQAASEASNDQTKRYDRTAELDSDQADAD
jgi:hypothetical protein